MPRFSTVSPQKGPRASLTAGHCASRGIRRVLLVVLTGEGQKYRFRPSGREKMTCFFSPENVRRRQSSKNVAQSPGPAVAEQHEVRKHMHRSPSLAYLCWWAAGGETLSYSYKRFSCAFRVFLLYSVGTKMGHALRKIANVLFHVFYIIVTSLFSVLGKNPRSWFSQEICKSCVNICIICAHTCVFVAKEEHSPFLSFFDV